MKQLHPEFYKVKQGTTPLYIAATHTHIHADGLTPRANHVWRPDTTLCGMPHDGIWLAYLPINPLCKTCERIALGMGYTIA